MPLINVPTPEEQYGIDFKELQDLMQNQGSAAVAVIAEYGGVEEICELLHTNPITGIHVTPGSLEVRRILFGTNSIEVAPPKTFIELVFEALHDSTLIILEVAAFLSLAIVFYKKIRGNDGQEQLEFEKFEWVEGVAILFSIVIVVLVTAFNDYSKELQFRGLQARLDEEHRIPLVRDGEIFETPVQEIVVGDVCLIKYGDFIPADGILLHSNDLKIDESSLTGEPELVVKGVHTDPMILSGSSVMEGSGRILITAVGSNSQSGIILELLGVNQSIDKKITEAEVRRRKSLAKQNISSLIGGKSRTDINQFQSQPADPGPTYTVHAPKRERSILQHKLLALAITIGKAGTLIAVLTVAILILQFLIDFFQQGSTWQASDFNTIIDYVIIGVSVLVVAVPEGLPLAVTLSLAYSVKKMMKDNNLVRHLDACETMGNATTICSDKTGTLTTNRMTVVQIFVCEKLYRTVPYLPTIPDPVGPLIVEGISINSLYSSKLIPSPGELPKQAGNKTECGLLGLVNDMGANYETIRNSVTESQIMHVYTFNSIRKSMSTVIRIDANRYRVYTKGASEIILEKCSYIHNLEGKVDDLSEYMQNRLNRKVIEPMANFGLRTIAIAYRDFVYDTPDGPNQVQITEEPNWDEEHEIVVNLTFLCVTGIEDPVRPEVPDAILQCQRAGITIRMVTGDNINTARSIAIKCGIIQPGDHSLVLDGKEFNRRIRDSNGDFNQQLFDEVWPRLRVLARSSPTDKYVLVKGIIDSKVSKFREVVAVTGDGTNDGPALKKADVGFAMGIAGTEVAKEASDIIITDDNFRSIVKAVMWGRNVYDSISKFIQFQLTVNVTAVIIAFTGACVIRNSPLKAVQLLWVNIIMDTLASLALATEIPNESILNRKPDGRTKPIISPLMLKNIVMQSIYQLTVLLFMLFKFHHVLQIHHGQEYGKAPSEHFTIIFNTLVLMTLFNEISSRKVRGERNIFEGLTKNKIFIGIWLGTFTSQILIVQYGDLVFFTTPLSVKLWCWSFLFGIGALVWGQIYMFIPVERFFQKLYDRFLPELPDDPENPYTANTDGSGRNRSGSQDNDTRPMWVRSSKRLTYQMRAVSNFAINADEKRAQLTRDILDDMAMPDSPQSSTQHSQTSIHLSSPGKKRKNSQ